MNCVIMTPSANPHASAQSRDAFNERFPVGSDVLVDTPAGTRLGHTTSAAFLIGNRCVAVRVSIGGKPSTQAITYVRKFEEPALP